MGKGKLYVVGTGPGHTDYICQRALDALADSEVITGYKTYTDLIQPLTQGKEVLSSGMRKEVERCQEAVDIAAEGKRVSMISSGDAGIYGMAGLVLEIVHERGLDVEVEVVPGITSAISSASLVGAPLMNDFVVISLSDLMTPWEVILHRLEHAIKGDFVMVIYNPKSKKRIEQLNQCVEMLLEHRDASTPVAIVKSAMREEGHQTVTMLGEMLSHEIDMTTTLIVGNSQTYISQGKMITPRGYKGIINS